jgi:hypothetical protein
MTTHKKLTPYWIIINWKRRAIWKKPYASLEEAQIELRTQAQQKPNHEWIIEQRETFREVEQGDNGEFSKF